MDSARREQSGSPSDSIGIAGAAISAFDALDTPGHHDVRIFGLPRNQLIMLSVSSLLFMLPLAILVGMLPFWERVGDFFFLKQLNSYVAPAVDNLSFEHSAGQFPAKRFLISCISLVELIFLSNIAAQVWQRVRKHSLLVWSCYDRAKLLQYTGICGLIFISLWYVLFFDWTVAALMLDRGSRFLIYGMMAMPFVAFIFGHMLAIVGLGIGRASMRKLKLLRK